MSEAKIEKKPSKSRVAAVLVRSHIDFSKNVKDTLSMLRLYRKNYCAVIEKTSSNMGMLQKVKDAITWGDLDENTFSMLIKKKAEKDPKDSSRNKKFFRLHPPRKGFGRKGIKQPFSKGGALGCRGDKINDLIQRML